MWILGRVCSPPKTVIDAFRERLHRQQVDGEIQAHPRRIAADRRRPNDRRRHHAGIAHHDALGDHLGLVVLGQREQLEVLGHARLGLEAVHAGRRREDELLHALPRRAIDEAHPGEHVHFPRGIRIEIDRRIVGDVGQVEDRVERREIDLVDPPDVHRADSQPAVGRQVIAEPLRVQHGDVVVGAGQHGLVSFVPTYPQPPVISTFTMCVLS